MHEAVVRQRRVRRLISQPPSSDHRQPAGFSIRKVTMHFRRVPTVQPQQLHAVLQQIIVEPSKVPEVEWEVVAIVEAC
ncbi:hypothetical protein NK8_74800 (plasmid) [Caballeronia sp. NK8]|nr:hypothetical protein NK8_74800 [Caballeronia sp. NK8]